MDEALSSFFRRMTFTPDGSLLIVPGSAHAVALNGAVLLCLVQQDRDRFYRAIKLTDIISCASSVNFAPRNLQADSLRRFVSLNHFSEQSDWCNMTTCRYAGPSFTNEGCPDPIFRQGHLARMKNLVWGGY